MSALSPRALAQLAVVGGAGNQESPRIFHVDPKAIEIEAAEQQRLIDEERARQQHQQHLEEDARRVEAEEVTRLPLWKMMVLPEGKRVRTCSGLHFVDSSVLEGEIEQTPRPPEKRWSPRGTRRPSPRHHRITTLNSPSSDTHY